MRQENLSIPPATRAQGRRDNSIVEADKSRHILNGAPERVNGYQLGPGRALAWVNGLTGAAPPQIREGVRQRAGRL